MSKAIRQCAIFAYHAQGETLHRDGFDRWAGRCGEVDVIYHSRSSQPPRMKRQPQDFVLPLWLERRLAAWVRWTHYDDYLQSIVWRSKRQRALRRAEYACQICNSRQRLEVHHREYPAQWGFEPDNDITVLCAACHRRHHGV